MKRPFVPQPTPKELTEELLGFLGRKFYQGDGVNFQKDRSRLLAWVVLWPASWLQSRGVTISTENYRKIVMEVFMDAVIHGTEKIRYRPAWLKQVIQSHFAMHGDEIYDAAKALRSLVENAIAITGKLTPGKVSDPMREMSLARSLMSTRKVTKKTEVKEQLPLL